jgi:hypothetical protein
MFSMRSLGVVSQGGGDGGGAGEVQDGDPTQRLAVDRDQPPPTCRRCVALPDTDPTAPHSQVRRPPLNILSTTAAPGRTGPDILAMAGPVP